VRDHVERDDTNHPHSAFNGKGCGRPEKGGWRSLQEMSFDSIILPGRSKEIPAIFDIVDPVQRMRRRAYDGIAPFVIAPERLFAGNHEAIACSNIALWRSPVDRTE
jgi:hypothetical protein